MSSENTNEDHKISDSTSENRDIGSNRKMWAFAMYTFVAIFIATEIIKLPGFWSSYVADIVGPAWFYILLRGLFAKKQPTKLGKVFYIPELAFVTVAFICVIGELAQYFGLYDRRFDPFDFVAYGSAVIPLYIIDRWQMRRKISK